MDRSQFEPLTNALREALRERPTRRSLIPILAAAPFAAGALGALETDARRKNKNGKGGKCKGKNKKKPKCRGGGGGGGDLGLQEICEPGSNSCQSGLTCDTPTTRHTCSSTVEGVDTWCCVPPGGKCTECDCCGDYYCDFGDANPDGACIPNPEG